MKPAIVTFFLAWSVESLGQQYYPLQVGNEWHYIVESWSSPPTTFMVRVFDDTTMPNGKTYSALTRPDLTGFRYVRVDSAGIHYFWEQEGRELLFYKSDASLYEVHQPDSVWFFSVGLLDVYSLMLFGDTTVVREFSFAPPYVLIELRVTLSDRYGPIRYLNQGEPPGTSYVEAFLIGAIIAGDTSGVLTSTVAQSDEVPERFLLQQNYPNPFNPSTTIRYELPRRVRVMLRIYNLLGEEVATVVDEEKEAGRYDAVWDAAGFASGVYLYRLQAAKFVQTKKMIILK